MSADRYRLVINRELGSRYASAVNGSGEAHADSSQTSMARHGRRMTSGEEQRAMVTATAFARTNGAAAKGAGFYGHAPSVAVIRCDDRYNCRIYDLVASVAS